MAEGGAQALQTPNGIPPEYWGYAQQAAQQYGVPLSLLGGLLTQENGWRATGTSPAGALGIAQLMPATARALGVDPLEPRQAIPGAARYLRQGYEAAGNDWTGALVYYNAGPEGLAAYQRSGTLPAETQRYVPAVRNIAAQLNNWLTTNGLPDASPSDVASAGGFGVPAGTPDLAGLPGKLLGEVGTQIRSGVGAATRDAMNHAAEFWNRYYPHIFLWTFGIGLLALGTFGLATSWQGGGLRVQRPGLTVKLPQKTIGA